MVLSCPDHLSYCSVGDLLWNVRIFVSFYFSKCAGGFWKNIYFYVFYSFVTYLVVLHSIISLESCKLKRRDNFNIFFIWRDFWKTTFFIFYFTYDFLSFFFGAQKEIDIKKIFISKILFFKKCKRNFWKTFFLIFNLTYNVFNPFPDK